MSNCYNQVLSPPPTPTPTTTPTTTTTTTTMATTTTKINTEQDKKRQVGGEQTSNSNNKSHWEVVEKKSVTIVKITRQQQHQKHTLIYLFCLDFALQIIQVIIKEEEEEEGDGF